MIDKILTQNQISFLKKAGRTDFIKENFYLTGGTALAAFYLEHRYSEDLDFFSEKEVDPLNIDVFLKSIKKDLGIKKIDFQQSFNRNLFFLHFNDEVLKTEFTYFPFAKIEKDIIHENIKIDSLLDITVNKLFTIYQRTKARDYVDLYCIIQKENYVVKDLIKKAKLKFDWPIDLLQLGAQFTRATETKDYPRMVYNIKPEEWQNFFIEEAKKLKNDILTDH